jgi:hypothetical protein
MIKGGSSRSGCELITGVFSVNWELRESNQNARVQNIYWAIEAAREAVDIAANSCAAIWPVADLPHLFHHHYSNGETL